MRTEQITYTRGILCSSTLESTLLTPEESTCSLECVRDDPQRSRKETVRLLLYLLHSISLCKINEINEINEINFTNMVFNLRVEHIVKQILRAYAQTVY